MLTEQQRVDYYMGKKTKICDTYEISSDFIPKERGDCKRDIVNVINWQDHLSTSDFDNDGYWFKDFTQREGKIPLWNSSKYNKKWFSFVWGDSLDPVDHPTLTKVRWINGGDENDNKCIWKIEQERHWGEMFLGCVYNYRKGYLGYFQRKKPMIGWRGATTGCDRFWENRGLFIKTHSDNPYCDIGFNWITMNEWLFKPQELRFIKDNLKPPQTLNQQLQYKYVVSIDGNDKASDLNWKLASNSVVFMKPPVVESWLMEGLLKPWVHYVPLADDFSDLNQKLIWAENNLDKCLQIIRNANMWMGQFLDYDREQRIMNKVMERFIDNVNIEIV